MRRTQRTTAFTLIELLVVIAVISLLLGIMVPVVSMTVRKTEDYRAGARVSELGLACMMYRNQDGGEIYYPGQQYPEMLLGSTAVCDPKLTGSQLLARALFWQDDLGDFGSSKYASLELEDDLLTFRDMPDSISDKMSRPMAIVYFPARPGIAGPEQYVYGDNAPYVDAGEGEVAFYRDFTVVPSSQKVRHDGKYLIIAAGMDRVYFTADDHCFPPKER